MEILKAKAISRKLKTFHPKLISPSTTHPNGPNMLRMLFRWSRFLFFFFWTKPGWGVLLADFGMTFISVSKKSNFERRNFRIHWLRTRSCLSVFLATATSCFFSEPRSRLFSLAATRRTQPTATRRMAILMLEKYQSWCSVLRKKQWFRIPFIRKILVWNLKYFVFFEGFSFSKNSKLFYFSFNKNSLLMTNKYFKCKVYFSSSFWIW